MASVIGKPHKELMARVKKFQGAFTPQHNMGTAKAKPKLGNIKPGSIKR